MILLYEFQTAQVSVRHPAPAYGRLRFIRSVIARSWEGKSAEGCGWIRVVGLYVGRDVHEADARVLKKLC
jgi:hypothetical protein